MKAFLLSLIWFVLVFCMTVNAKDDSHAEQDSNVKNLTGITEDTLMVTVKRDNMSILIYPNPFRKESTVNFTLDENDRVTIKLYDVQGREIRSLVESKEMQSGDHVFEFDRQELDGGFYLVQLISKKGLFAKEVILVE